MWYTILIGVVSECSRSQASRLYCQKPSLLPVYQICEECQVSGVRTYHTHYLVHGNMYMYM